MSDMFETQNEIISDDQQEENLKVKIIGVGGAGCNAVDRLKMGSLDSVYHAIVTTDWKTYRASPVSEKVMIGRTVTRGQSAGGEADIGRAAAEADQPLLEKLVNGTDLVFIVAGLGGGTGSGAAPIIAKLAEEAGALVVAFVGQPFSHEGARRLQQASDALTALRKSCHAVIPLPNDLLLQVIDDNATVMEAFELAESWIERGIRGIWSMLFQQGLINVDFGTIRQAFGNRGGKTLFGLGEGSGADAVKDALSDLSMCPLLHLPEYKYAREADSLIVNITGGPDLSMSQVKQIMNEVTEKFGSKESTVLGAVIDDSLRETVRITVIGTTDVGGRKYRRAQPHSKAASTPAAHSGSTLGDRLESKSKTKSKKDQKQIHFDFPAEEERRGFFDKTDANLYEGEDLDVPTYLRRGIRIQLTS